jgi:predicted NBD/HSP70 family sugar kinase
MLQNDEAVRPLDRPGSSTAPFVVGMDVGGTKIRAASARLDGTIVAEIEAATRTDGAAVVDQIVEIARAVSIVGSPQAVTVGVPGAVDGLGHLITRANNLPALGVAGVADSLRRALGVPTVFDNDVNIAALGEWRAGGRPAGTHVTLALGTGIGMGIVVDGSVLRGKNGAAGEIAELPFGGRAPFPAEIGTAMLESTVSTPGLLRLFHELGGRGCETGEQLLSAVLAGDGAACGALRSYAREVARAVITVRAILDPVAIVLTGGLGSQPQVRDNVAEWLTLAGVPTEVLHTSPLGDRSGVVGALQLATDLARRSPESLDGPAVVSR